MAFTVGQKLLASQLATIQGLVANGLSVPTGVGAIIDPYCTADTTVNNSTTLVNVTGLSASLEANAKYSMDGFIAYTSGATPDIKFAWTVPSGATGWWAAWSTSTAAAGTVGSVVSFWDTTFTAAQSAGGSDTLSGNCSCLPHAYVVTTNAGTIQLQFAQNTANASNTIVRAGSWLRFRRVA
jgi:hypothetical protein